MYLIIGSLFINAMQSCILNIATDTVFQSKIQFSVIHKLVYVSWLSFSHHCSWKLDKMKW